MKLTEQLTGYIHAAFTGLWVQTAEPDEAEREILHLARQQNWRLAAWDIANGLRFPGSAAPSETTAGDPLTALRAVTALANPGETALLLLHNFHRFLTSPEVVQTVFTQLLAGKQRRHLRSAIR